MTDTIRSKRLEGTTLIIETSSGTETYDAQFLVAAMLIFIARGSGSIHPDESAKMIDLIEEHFHLQGAQSLELLTRAMSELAEKPELGAMLADLGPTLSDAEKEEITLMALKVIAVSPETVHRAFDRYFSETMPGG